MVKKAVKEMFSEDRIALMREVSKNHPALVEKIAAQNIPANDWELQLAAIATHCNVVLDGFYTPKELDRLAEMLYYKLVDSRKIILSSARPVIIH